MQPAQRPGAAYLAGAPLLIAHRGGAGLAPENTLLAFSRAHEWWGSDILELDVNLTRDGEAVVIHDATVDRTTDGVGRVRDLPLPVVQGLDAGFRFTPDGGRTHPFRGRGIGVPTLGEVLRMLPGVRVNIELKDAQVGERVVEVIREQRAEGRVLLAAGRRGYRRSAGGYAGPVSASGEELRAFHLLHTLRLARTFRGGVDALQMPHRHRGREVVSSRLVRAAHDRNVAVHVWTVNEEAEMLRLLQMGVDGIVTDRPDRLAGVLHATRGRPLPPGGEPSGGRAE